MTIGDHPMCEDHLALSLDWKHSQEKVCDLDQYEMLRLQEGRSPRGRVNRLNYQQRRQLLELVGPWSNDVSEYDVEDESSTMDVECTLEDLRNSDSLFDDNVFGFPANMMKVQILEG